MRGEKVFNGLFSDKEAANAPKGRSLSLVARRNHCLVDRYFYYGHYTDKRFDVIIENLCAEFFLTERTVKDIINKQESYLLELKKKKPIVSLLDMRWPHLKW